MSRNRVAFFIAVAGGITGYACGAAFNQPSAVAQQQSVAADAGYGMQGGTGGGAATGGSNGSPSQLATPACAQWEVKLGPQVDPLRTGTIEAGWEPYAWSESYGRPLLRRCIR